MRNLKRNAMAVADNAVFYKDITQWLRTRTFVGLFALLLVVAEFSCMFIVSAPMGEGQAGPALFGTLSVILAIYLFILAFQSFAATGREQANRTFELYELSGMSLEKMVFGKLLSQLGQFCFGFFCVVPFLFFSYLLGGLDFYDVLAAILFFGVVAVPVYLFSVLSSLMMKAKGMAGLGRLIPGVGLIFLFFTVGIRILSFLFMGFARRGGRGGVFASMGPGGFLKSIFQFNPEAWTALAIFGAFYALICLLMFYAACNSISPPSDSRETSVKFLFTSLVAAWIAQWTYLLVHSTPSGFASIERGGSIYTIALSGAIAAGIMSVLGYYHRLAPPLVAFRRAQRAPVWQRPVYWLFAAGARGSMRAIILILALPFISFTLFALRQTPNEREAQTVLRAVSFDLVVPFFVIFPMGFLMHMKKLRGKTKQVRAMLLIWWVVAGVVPLVLYMIAFNGLHSSNDAFKFVAELLCLVGSPISTGLAGAESRSAFVDAAPDIRIVLGVIGLVYMIRSLRRRSLWEAREIEAIREAQTPPKALPAAYPKTQPPPLPTSLMAPVMPSFSAVEEAMAPEDVEAP